MSILFTIVQIGLPGLPHHRKQLLVQSGDAGPPIHNQKHQLRFRNGRLDLLEHLSRNDFVRLGNQAAGIEECNAFDRSSAPSRKCDRA